MEPYLEAMHFIFYAFCLVPNLSDGNVKLSTDRAERKKLAVEVLYTEISRREAVAYPSGCRLCFIP